MLMKEDLTRIERQADKSFESGQMVGLKVRKLLKKSTIFLAILISSIIASIFFFLYGFLDHKHRSTL